LSVFRGVGFHALLEATNVWRLRSGLAGTKEFDEWIRNTTSNSNAVVIRTRSGFK